MTGHPIARPPGRVNATEPAASLHGRARTDGTKSGCNPFTP